jgi:phospholipid/cholesterol/gamma-HCH transport system substrate-binding protein
LSNLEKTSSTLANADINGTIQRLQASVNNLNGVISKVNSTDGTLGKLINDKALYNNLTNAVRSANILLDDLRVNPKRYVNISVFGKKEKGTYLTAPLNDSTQK